MTDKTFSVQQSSGAMTSRVIQGHVTLFVNNHRQRQRQTAAAATSKFLGLRTTQITWLVGQVMMGIITCLCSVTDADSDAEQCI